MLDKRNNSRTFPTDFSRIFYTRNIYKMRKSTAELPMHDNFTIYYRYLQTIVENIGRYITYIYIYIHLFILIQIILTNTLKFSVEARYMLRKSMLYKKKNSKSRLKEHICTKCVKDMVRAEWLVLSNQIRFSKEDLNEIFNGICYLKLRENCIWIPSTFR